MPTAKCPNCAVVFHFSTAVPINEWIAQHHPGADLSQPLPSLCYDCWLGANPPPATADERYQVQYWNGTGWKISLNKSKQMMTLDEWARQRSGVIASCGPNEVWRLVKFEVVEQGNGETV